MNPPTSSRVTLCLLNRKSIIAAAFFRSCYPCYLFKIYLERKAEDLKVTHCGKVFEHFLYERSAKIEFVNYCSARDLHVIIGDAALDYAR